MNKQVQVIGGNDYIDNRGKLTFFNELNIEDVKRFYVIEPAGVDFIRAWQGHKSESKWFHVNMGSFKIILVKPDNWDNPSNNLDWDEYILSSHEPKVLYVPGGFANGFKALEPNSRMTVYSDFLLDQSLNDDYRFDRKLWYNWDK